jgi:(1->4)-alpha-D-glucan 1-alpha-D-glucosylmutase
MLSTSTHDTKRGEDLRARLLVLSEMPEEWARQVRTWSRILRARRGDVEGTAPPHPNDEYLFFQLLLGAWPAEMMGKPPGAESMAELCTRLQETMRKSLREAKQRSGWAAPNAGYEEAMAGFVRDTLDTDASAAFFEAFLPFQARIAEAGLRNALVQVVLKLTLPGMPDLYQGSELWELSLVDPDNRRPVDFARRARLLAEVEQDLARDPGAAVRSMLEGWQDGRVKLAVTAALLAHRRARPGIFAQGSYAPVLAQGEEADRICAFLRTEAEDALLVLASRFPARGPLQPGTMLPWPEAAPDCEAWRDLLTGRLVRRDGPALEAGSLLDLLPAAVLVPARPGSFETGAA